MNPFSKPENSTPSTTHKTTAEADISTADQEPKTLTGDGSGKVLPLVEEKDDTELSQSDPETEERYPVENGAVRWDDAANEGDTSRIKTAVYDTPWGRRELTALEVQDFGAQGVPVTRVDDEPHTSLEAEREELRKIELTNRDADKTGDR